MEQNEVRESLGLKWLEIEAVFDKSYGYVTLLQTIYSSR